MFQLYGKDDWYMHPKYKDTFHENTGDEFLMAHFLRIKQH